MDLEKLYQLKRVKSMIRYITQVFQKEVTQGLLRKSSINVPLFYRHPA